MTIERRAFVLLSGGIDSSTALAVAIAQEQSVYAFSINYGQRHFREIRSADQVCQYLGVPHFIRQMSGMPASMLTDAKQEIPNCSYADLPVGISPTYVPFRNGQMLSLLAGVAQAWVMHAPDQREATVWFGAHAEDAHNWAYPDCTPEFIGAMANAIYIGTYHKVRLIAPFQHMSKSEIVKIGKRLGVPYHLTFSCYRGGPLHCGTCPTCLARKAAFADADVSDPTEYVTAG